MSFSKTQNTELYVYSGIVESYLGKRASTVVSCLIDYGRLSLKDLVKRTKMQGVLVKKTLVSLIQLNCISVWEETNFRSTTTFYSFREDGALLMLYSGEIISHIEEIYNNDPSTTQIVQNFLSLGNLTISDYIASLGALDAETIDKLERCFMQLVRDKFLVPVQKSHFYPVKDLWMKTMKTAYLQVPNGAALSELKRTAEAKEKAKLQFFNILNAEPEALYLKDKATSILKINSNISLTFNLKRYMKSRRSIQLAQLCSHRVGKVTSKVFYKALLHDEKNSPDVVNLLHQIGLTNEEIVLGSHYEPLQNNLFAAKDIVKNIDFSLDNSIVTGVTKRTQPTAKLNNTKRIKLENGDYGIVTGNGDMDGDDDSDDEDDFDDMGEGFVQNGAPLATVDQHLRILTNSSIPFLKKDNSSYYIPYPELMIHLKRSLSDSIISSTLGSPCARIMRCVRGNRLVSEKFISSTALLREKDARSLTSTLVKYNMLQIQEVPKTADRAASKSVFLFRVNEKHGNNTLKTNICWNMGKILEKIALLKAENAQLISKINRDDVKGKELEYLLPSELTQLKKMNDTELMLTTKLHRLISLWEVFKFY